MKIIFNYTFPLSGKDINIAIVVKYRALDRLKRECALIKALKSQKIFGENPLKDYFDLARLRDIQMRKHPRLNPFSLSAEDFHLGNVVFWIGNLLLC